eukprot:gene11444-2082_t
MQVQYQPLTVAVDFGFWQQVMTLKANQWALSEEPVTATAVINPSGAPCLLLSSSAFSAAESGAVQSPDPEQTTTPQPDALSPTGSVATCPRAWARQQVSGTVAALNTSARFQQTTKDKNALEQALWRGAPTIVPLPSAASSPAHTAAAEAPWASFVSGGFLRSPLSALAFAVVSMPDLKHHKHSFMAAVPSFRPSLPITRPGSAIAADIFSAEEFGSILSQAACLPSDQVHLTLTSAVHSAPLCDNSDLFSSHISVQACAFVVTAGGPVSLPGGEHPCNPVVHPLSAWADVPEPTAPGSGKWLACVEPSAPTRCTAFTLSADTTPQPMPCKAMASRGSGVCPRHTPEPSFGQCTNVGPRGARCVSPSRPLGAQCWWHRPEQASLPARGGAALAGPSSLARNLVSGLAVHLRHTGPLRLLCVRGSSPGAAHAASFEFTLQVPEGAFRVPAGQADGDAAPMPPVVGWEAKQGRPHIRLADLSAVQDPGQMAREAASLNLSLMRWRMLPSINLPALSGLQCLLVGSGTLGCNVARCLMSWGITHITFVDYGGVSYSNPVRQSLFEFADCLPGEGRPGAAPKAQAAAEACRRILPGVEVQGVQMAVPMPGHIIDSTSEPDARATIARLAGLVSESDVVFMLTDSRESRWLPSLLAASQSKLAITIALGFDTWVAMRHGLPGRSPLIPIYRACPHVWCNNHPHWADPAGATRSSEALAQDPCGYPPHYAPAVQRDIATPDNTQRDRTLDQQCTVTRPGVSSIAAACGVEMMAALTQHPQGFSAPAAQDVSQPSGCLGDVPQQLRGSLHDFRTDAVTGTASSLCTACSPAILAAYAERGADLVIDACNDPTSLDRITGVDKMKADFAAMLEEDDFDFDDDDDDD